MESEQTYMPVPEVSWRYPAPDRYDSMLEACTRIDEVGHVTVRIGFRLVRKSDGKLLAVGETCHASLGQMAGRGASPTR